MKKIISISTIVIIMAISTTVYYLHFVNVNTKDNNLNILNTEDESKISIIAFGDSLTAGYGLLESESYPRQLEAKLLVDKYNVNVINAGISGETSAGALARTDFILSQDPKLALLSIGGNDALRGLSQKEADKNIKAIIQKLKTKISKDKIFLLKIQVPANLGLKYKRDFDNMYEKIADSEGVTVVDFVVDEVFLNSQYMLEDGIHPNKEGYKILVDKYIYPKVIKVLDK